MAREQQKDLAQKFIDAQSNYDTDAMTSVLASDAKHDLLPSSLGVPSKDNAGKAEITKKMGSALGGKAVPIKVLQTIQDVEQRKCAMFISKEYEFGPVQSFFVLNFNEDNSKITHTVEFVNAEAQKKLMAKMG
ncbi:hypothetical protein BAUCODRAFT_124911 [Baudoinia panamericana UAMH 10762]|uniref:SnoaL-like domain-containing protein n=1 Tax=Baudoinia panamericana (strain UAMH 10762) TaxID=717646 RepID=M2N581_BAUPA|nr:uncharacterized protein BAUCODRAFT_124911 [Baudoinia panamericana UAMH 10762]EMC94194.1 hypothetical protein BAUCODRAFT_124911 [Baudoinia panamericana UAMH 10762]